MLPTDCRRWDHLGRAWVICLSIFEPTLKESAYICLWIIFFQIKDQVHEKSELVAFLPDIRTHVLGKESRFLYPCMSISPLLPCLSFALQGVCLEACRVAPPCQTPGPEQAAFFQFFSKTMPSPPGRLFLHDSGRLFADACSRVRHSRFCF